jgi:RNA polymerase sigma factor (sigma-70 family)
MGFGAILEGSTVDERMDFDDFFHVHVEKVARAAALVTRDATAGQDIAQEAFTRLLERWGEMRSDDHARNFVYKVAMNLGRSHLRKHGRVSLYGLRQADEPGVPSAEGSMDDWIEVVEALGTLSARQRACVVLVDYVDMDSVAVGEVLGVSANTVRVHLMRGRDALRQRLGLTQREERT